MSKEFLKEVIETIDNTKNYLGRSTTKLKKYFDADYDDANLEKQMELLINVLENVGTLAMMSITVNFVTEVLKAKENDRLKDLYDEFQEKFSSVITSVGVYIEMLKKCSDNIVNRVCKEINDTTSQLFSESELKLLCVGIIRNNSMEKSKSIDQVLYLFNENCEKEKLMYYFQQHMILFGYTMVVEQLSAPMVVEQLSAPLLITKSTVTNFDLESFKKHMEDTNDRKNDDDGNDE
jgi:hypothetical protein